MIIYHICLEGNGAAARVYGQAIAKTGDVVTQPIFADTFKNEINHGTRHTHGLLIYHRRRATTKYIDIAEGHIQTLHKHSPGGD